MDDQPIVSMPSPSMQEAHNPSFFSKYKFTIISLVIILVALVPLIMLSKNSKKTPPPTTATTQVANPTPTVPPLTEQNVSPTLAATDQKIQGALDQTTQDLNSVNQIDTSQDSVQGL